MGSFTTPDRIVRRSEDDRQRQIEGLVNSGLLTPEEEQAFRLEHSKLRRTRLGLGALDPGAGEFDIDALLAGLGSTGGGGFVGGGGPTQAELDIAIRGLDIREQQVINDMLNAGRDREVAELLGLGRIDVDQSRIDLDRMLGVGQQSQDLFFGVQNIGLQNRGFDIQELLAGNQLSFDRQQLGEEILLARDQMEQDGGFRQQDIDLRIEQMMQDAGFTQQELDLASDRLELDKVLGTRGMDLQEFLGKGQLEQGQQRIDLDRLLGMGGLDLQRELGMGRLDLDRFLGEGQLGLGQGRLDLDRFLGTGQLDLGRGRLDLDRLLGTGELELGRGRLGLQREQFVEEQVLNQAALSANPRRVFEAAFAQAGRDLTAGSELLQNFIDF